MKKTLFVFILLFSFCGLNAQKKLVILHTNDTHSRIEPMSDTDRKNPNMGGVVNRKAIIDSIRQVEDNVLLIDAGDFVQGTPYFNMFLGKVETETLNRLGYEVGTIGNHEFDNGMEGLKTMISDLSFPIVNCNYDFSQTPLKGMIKPYVILKKNGLNIGVIGVGVDPDGLIQKDKYEGMLFNPIIESVNHYAKELKNKCDLIIALTHIGIKDDMVLAEESENVNLIIGSHSHTFMDEPAIVKNRKNKDVLVYQAGKSGIFIGKIELEFEKK